MRLAELQTVLQNYLIDKRSQPLVDHIGVDGECLRVRIKADCFEDTLYELKMFGKGRFDLDLLSDNEIILKNIHPLPYQEIYKVYRLWFLSGEVQRLYDSLGIDSNDNSLFDFSICDSQEGGCYVEILEKDVSFQDEYNSGIFYPLLSRFGFIARNITYDSIEQTVTLNIHEDAHLDTLIRYFCEMSQTADEHEHRSSLRLR